MKEKWRPVVGYEDLYAISNLGRLHSNRAERVMKPAPDNDGYYKTMLCRDRHRLSVSIHRLVAQAFIPNPENKKQVNHIDGNKQNNCVENLEWCTQKENIHHAFKIGLRPVGEDRVYSKLDNSGIRLIKLLRGRKIPMQSIGVILGVSYTTISGVIHGRSWKHLKYENIMIKDHWKNNYIAYINEEEGALPAEVLIEGLTKTQEDITLGISKVDALRMKMEVELAELNVAIEVIKSYNSKQLTDGK